MKINIGTTKGNITNVEINKKFEDITYREDILPIMREKFGKDAYIIGWVETPKKRKE
jgi:hypothetical protein